jgi:DNA uptake protein ComE-like DNA-binding protein
MSYSDRFSGQKMSQPQTPKPHQKVMTFLNLRCAWSISLAALFVGITACTNKDNPDEIRRQTAEATETMRRDTKALVEGVKEGMHSDKAIDINTASREDLLNLPGMTQHEADRIIAERPFKNAHELVARHVIPESEYDKISDRIIAGH